MINSSWRVAVLGAVLLLLGFGVGYGFHTRQAAQVPRAGNSAARALAEPLFKGLHVSPDDRYLAFAGIYQQLSHASRFVLDLQSQRCSAVELPVGWQDYPTQWSNDSHAILFEREKIPHPVEDATAGIYTERIDPGDFSDRASVTSRPESAQLLTQDAPPPGEKIITGQWTADRHLIVKTRRESKALYAWQIGGAALLDRAAVNYLQTRTVRENGRTVVYAVRDVPGQPEQNALFRIDRGVARRLGPAVTGLTWAYLTENARWLIYCRPGAGDNWQWSLYAVTPTALRLAREAAVPGDVVSVYWSPDGHTILGASGQSLWAISIPSLQTRRLGDRTDWNSDDAAWLAHSPAVIVAANGRLWRVEIADGKARQIWRFPERYWR